MKEYFSAREALDLLMSDQTLDSELIVDYMDPAVKQEIFSMIRSVMAIHKAREQNSEELLCEIIVHNEDVVDAVFVDKLVQFLAQMFD